MDNTNTNRSSDAAANRKRRSSILKSQRVSRAPLSELEFTVTTPTDTAKSRRVSFSRRTGVAEFVTNEATTTWKNFYEEHNKTLESSGNDTDIHVPRPSVAHLGKGNFNDQFLEVEVFDFEATGNTQEISMKKINANHTLECTASSKLNIPQANLEFSTFTGHQSKIFDDELAITGIGEITDKISMNFSVMQALEGDLEEMQNDVKQADENNRCRPRDKNVSEYLEVDLNMTHVGLKEDESDMSITDTVHSPKVNVLETKAPSTGDKSVNLDWVADKENIVLNPYVAPKESANFAINEESDKILVFDGKRVTVQSEKEPLGDYRKTLDSSNSRKSIGKSQLGKKTQNNTIVLNVDDDLPNFVENPHATLSFHSKTSNKTLLGDDGDLSITQPIIARIETKPDNRKTIVFENDGNISITHALSTNILCEDVKKRETIVFDNDEDISMTQAVPSNLVFVEDNLSNIEANNRNKSIVFEEGTSKNVSIPQVLSSSVIVTNNGEVLPVKRKTIVYETDAGNISVTQIVPSALILGNSTEKIKEEKRKTIVFDEDEGNISITEAVPANLFIQQSKDKVKVPEKRKTIVFDELEGNISITQAVPTNLLLPQRTEATMETKTMIFDSINAGDISITETNILSEKPHLDFEKSNLDDLADMSVTQAIPCNILSEKEKSVMYEYGNISVTQAVPSNLILQGNDDKNAIIPSVEPESLCQISPKREPEPDFKSEVISSTYLLDTKGIKDSNNPIESSITSSNTTITQELEEVDSNEADVSVTESDNLFRNDQSQHILVDKEDSKPCRTDKTYVFNESGLLGDTKNFTSPIPQALLDLEKSLMNKTGVKNLEPVHMQGIVVYQTTTVESRPIKVQDYTDISSSAAADQSETDVKTALVETEQGVTSEMKNVSPTQNPIESASPEIKEDKANISSTSGINVGLLDTSSTVARIQSNIQKSILDDLLDMREESDIEGTEDKSVTVKLSQHSDMKPVKSETDASSDSLFFITRDSADETQTDKSDDEKNNIVKNMANHSLKTVAPQEGNEHLQMEFENCIEDLEKKLLQLQQHSSGSRSPTRNRHFEKVLSSDLEALNSDYRGKSVKDADNTKDLLDMLSKFTDKEEEEDPIKPIELTGHLALEDKTKEEPIKMVDKCQKTDSRRVSDKNATDNSEKTEWKRLSAIPRKSSIVLSREDLFNNISMAQAALQACGTDADSETDAASSNEKSPSAKKNVRLSPEVVKTLRFEDDESTSDTSMKYESPLKKTAFGETSYMIDESRRKESTKAHVIPSYLKDVSDGIKELMSDLVKPMADVLPFDTSSHKEAVRVPSTCSTQVQANLVTSSQVDLDPETCDVMDQHNMSNSARKLKGIIKPYASQSADPSESCFEMDWKTERGEYDREEGMAIDQSVPGRVIVFDPSNPLNNVLISPINFNEAHRYEPAPSLAQPEPSEESTVNEPPPPPCPTTRLSFRDVDTEANERIAMNYNIPSVIPNFETKHLDFPQKPSLSVVSDTTKPASVDHSVETLRTDVKDEEINTDIAMKDNKKLLEESSSLTLVDNTSDNVYPYTNLYSGTSKDVSPSLSNRDSPVKLIYSQPISDKIDSDFVSDDAVSEVVNNKMKRKHSDKHKNCNVSALDTPPKPASKVLKHSLSPHDSRRRTSLVEEDNRSISKDISRTTKVTIKGSPVKSKKSPKRSPSPGKRPGTNVTVQQLLTEIHSDNNPNRELTNTRLETTKANDILDSKKMDLNNSMSISSSKTNDFREDMSDAQGPMEWRADSSKHSVRTLISRCDSDEGVRASIDLLHFMGNECEWESVSADWWSFRLLMGRLRLRVKLATDGRLRADTKVTDLAVETTEQTPNSATKNSIGVLSVRFAMESMRYYFPRCSCAGDVSLLLRRCAAVARLSLRWARAMHDAWLHIAYTMTTDGQLTFKVANIPLRSVFEVSLRVELVVCEGVSGPFPRASVPRVTTAVGPASLQGARVDRALQRLHQDWGHAPNTVWKVFKYLKNKTAVDELLLGI